MVKILLIEDHPDIRENTAELLELAGYEVYLAQNGTRGIEIAKEMRPDVILSDILMPEMDGWEVIRRLKNDPVTSEIPFIFISASVEKKEIQTGYDLGADGYIGKPFEESELLESIEKCLMTRGIFKED